MSIRAPSDTPSTTTNPAGQSSGALATLHSEVLQANEADLDSILQVKSKLAFCKASIKEWEGRIDAALFAYIEANGPQQVGPIKYYIGTAKTTKCRNVGKALEALLQATGGDFDEVVACLSSGAIKYGACRNWFEPAIWDTHFEQIVKREIKEDGSEGAPIRELVTANEEFLKPKKRKTDASSK